MEKYEPPEDFVERVMKEVRFLKDEASKPKKSDFFTGNSVVAGWVLSSGALLCSIWNIARLLLTHFGPAVCR